MEHDVIAIYLEEISRIPLLSREEETLCARKARAGDREARRRLINANLRFVVAIAKRYQRRGVPIEDLISEGNIGLMNAIERFDADKGYHFISYAVWWIRQRILRAVGDGPRMIKLPFHRANELAQIRKYCRERHLEHGSEPGIAEIAKHLGLEEKRVADLLRLSGEMISLEEPVDPTHDDAVLRDFLEDPRYPSLDEITMGASMRSDIDRLLANLSRKEAEIIRCRFGLGGRKPHSLKEVGGKYRLTKERIRQIEKRAMNKLRSASEAEHLRAYMVS